MKNCSKLDEFNNAKEKSIMCGKTDAKIIKLVEYKNIK